jgi:hypothetical protein
MDKGEWIKGVAHWVDGDVASISVAFTWRLPEARQIATYYRATGHTVRIGGPAVFTKRAKDYMAGYGEIGGSSPDAVARHNPMATFASRGCPVGCHFCIVTPMEGADFTEFPDFVVRPVLCDNNLSALSPAYQDHIAPQGSIRLVRVEASTGRQMGESAYLAQDGISKNAARDRPHMGWHAL